MRTSRVARIVSDASVAAVEAAAEQHEPRCVRALDRDLRRMVRNVIAEWQRTTVTVHASTRGDRAGFVEHAPDWEPPVYHVPITSTLVDEVEINAILGETTRQYRDAAVRDTGAAMANALELRFDVSNKLISGVIARQSGMKIVTAPSRVVGVMMDSLQNSYDKGHSIPKAAREMRKAGYAGSKHEAERIARTELVRATNGASLAMVQGGTDLKFKTWIGGTRPAHMEADGQIVPIDQPFDVGGEQLDYPGDDNGSAGNVINCRCTLGYAEAASTATIGGAGSMAAVETEQTEAEVGATWTGVIAQEGVDTGDGRRIEKDALKWRALPLTMMSQLVTPEYGGHTDAAVAGRIDTLERDGENIQATGVFDTGEHGATTERMVREQMLRGISVDLAVNEAEVIPAEDVDDPMEAWFMGTLSILDATILGATVVPFPAFENASIAIVAGAAMRLRNARYEKIDGKKTLVVSFHMPFAPEPPQGEKPDDEPAKPDPDKAEDDAVEKAMTALEDAVDALRSAIDKDTAADEGDD